MSFIAWCGNWPISFVSEVCPQDVLRRGRRKVVEPSQPNLNVAPAIHVDDQSPDVDRAVVRWLGLAVVAVGLVVRVALSFGPTISSGDLRRGVLSGRAVWEHGLATAGRPLIDTYPNANELVPWAENPFNYPPVPVIFFTLIAAVGGGNIVARLLLSLCDGISSVLIARITKRRWLGLAFWISPVSMWWSSKEGQFEGLQSTLALAALASMSNPVLSGFLLALAIQTKLTAAVLVPYVLFQMHKRNRLRRFVGGFAVGMLPTLVFSLVYPIIPNVLKYSTMFSANPYYWHPTAKTQIWLETTRIGAMIPQLVSFVLLFGVVFVAWRLHNWIAAMPALYFLMAMKFHVQFPGWYFATVALVLVPLIAEVNATMGAADERTLLQDVSGLSLGKIRGSVRMQTQVVAALLFVVAVTAETSGLTALGRWLG